MSSSITHRRPLGRASHGRPWLVAIVATGILLAPSGRALAADPAPDADPGLVLHGGEDGTAFRSLTVEGEDRIHIDYERPPLALDLAPETAPGLDWGSIEDVLNRTFPDMTVPLFTSSTWAPCPYLGHPWLEEFTTGSVAVFHPSMEGVDRWRLEVVDGRGNPVAAFEGKGKPPREIAWDGQERGGATAVPGRTYSYVFTSFDRAGNKRTFVGDGFEVSAYRSGDLEHPLFVFNGDDLLMEKGSEFSARRSSRSQVPPVMIEVASWINQIPSSSTPIRVTVVARSGEQAKVLGGRIVGLLEGLIPAAKSRVQSVSQVELDAPPSGVITITPLRSAAAARP